MKQKTETREAITLLNQDEKIFGILHRPQQEGKVPAVLLCSGYAGNKAGKFRLFVRLAEELARNGIAVLRFDYRGAGDSEGDFKDITVQGKISDTLKCLDFLSHDPHIDASRIGLLGRSLGGAIAVLAAKQYQKIKSLALWAPVFDSAPWKALWESFRTNQMSSVQKQELQRLPFGIPNLEFISQFFQIQVQEDLKTLHNLPILHIEATQDVVVKEQHGQGYRSVRQGIENTRFIQLLNSDHDFSDTSDQIMAIEETCQWFKKTL